MRMAGVETEVRQRVERMDTERKGREKGAGLMGGLAIFVSALGFACAPTSPLYEPIVGSNLYAPGDADAMANAPPPDALTILMSALRTAHVEASWYHDPTLDCAAGILGRHMVATKSSHVPFLHQQWTAWRCGVPGPIMWWGRYWWGGSPGTARDLLMSDVRDGAAGIAKNPYGKFGLAGGVTGQVNWVAIAISNSRVVTRPIRKVLSLGEPLTLEGCFLVPRANAILETTTAGPEVSEQPVVLDERRCFRLQAKLPSVAGVYYVQLSSEDPKFVESDHGEWGRAYSETESSDHWYQADLWFPVYVAVAEPEQVPTELLLTHPEVSLETSKRDIIEVYNKERLRFGLPPLTPIAKWEEAVDSDARFRAQKKDRLPVADLPADLRARYRGRTHATVDNFLEHAQANLMRPSKRAYVLDPSVAFICVGIAEIENARKPQDADKGDFPRYAVVEYFVRNESR